MSVARKRSGFMNDCRAYCYPDCNIIPRTLNIFPSVTTPCGTPNCNKTIGTNRYLGIQNGNNMLNYNLITNYNNRNMRYL